MTKCRKTPGARNVLCTTGVPIQLSGAKDQTHDPMVAAEDLLTTGPVGNKLEQPKEIRIGNFATASLKNPCKEFNAGSRQPEGKKLRPDRRALVRKAPHHVLSPEPHDAPGSRD